MMFFPRKKLIFFLLFTVLFFIPFFSFYLFFYQKPQPIKIKAQEEDDATFCKNHCQPAYGNQPDCRGKPDFYDEECCLRIQQTGDPSECPWPQRGWCMPEHCASIPEGVNRLRCAGPRESWCNMCKRCFKNLPSLTPLPSPSIMLPSPTPTFLPPTPSPTIIQKSNISPTPSFRQIFPTTKIPVLPTEEPSSFFPSPTPLTFNLPKFTLPTIKIYFKEIKQKGEETFEKPLGFFLWILDKIKFYDRLLEQKINQKIGNFFNF